MRSLVIAGCTVLTALAGSASAATTYHVGTGQPYATPSNVPWESLAAGDSVLIHWRATPYRDKWVICRAGTQNAPIVVRGLPDPGTGARPVIEGANAVTRSQLNFWSEGRGIIKIGGANAPPDLMPAWIVIEGLEIRGARPANTFTGRNGLTSYDNNASSIYIEKGQHVVVRDCRLTDCSNGFFCAHETSDLLVEKNQIDDNGNVGSIFEHNSYTEALGIVFQFNRMGPLRAGAGGNNLKDRSAGTVIRDNWIEGGNRQLDLVESDFPELIDDPSYRSTFVYGNVLYETGNDGNSQIVHYGGDNGGTAGYRKGTLYFHFNTVVSKRTGNTTLFRLSTDDESCDARDNVVFVSAAGTSLALLDQDGALDLTKNWFKTGWRNSFSGGAVSVNDHGQVTGSDPGFANLAGADFALAAGSPCLDQAAALAPACLPAHAPALQYVLHRASMPRPNDGALDLGAFERSSLVGVGDGRGGPASGDEGGLAARAALAPMPTPFSGACRIRLVPNGVSEAAARALESVTMTVVGADGRSVARVEPAAPGLWVWTPAAATPPGVYWLRVGETVRAVVLQR
jgi:hypothetical protein